MDLAIPEELRMVQRTVKRFVDQELRPLEREVEETDRIAPEVDRALLVPVGPLLGTLKVDGASPLPLGEG